MTIAKLNPFFGQKDLDDFDQALQRRGFEVQHLLNPKTAELKVAAKDKDAVFINIYISPMSTMGTMRITLDSFPTFGWRALFTEHSRVFYTSFGTPYLLYELPHLPNLIVTYSGTPESQEAAAKFWLGEMDAAGVLPVTLPRSEIRPLAPVDENQHIST